MLELLSSVYRHPDRALDRHGHARPQESYTMAVLLFFLFAFLSTSMLVHAVDHKLLTESSRFASQFKPRPAGKWGLSPICPFRKARLVKYVRSKCDDLADSPREHGFDPTQCVDQCQSRIQKEIHSRLTVFIPVGNIKLVAGVTEKCSCRSPAQ